uniref:Uncharacterized protein n=1 Tax=Romanomermis culicivorax TaxID=13658 RepID=A0A915J0T0_ROMCU
MDAFGHSSSLTSFAFLIVALIIIDRHNRIDGLILCNCSNPGQMFDVDPRSMVPLPSADLQDQLDSNFNVSSGDVTTLADSYSTNTITDSIINAQPLSVAMSLD